MWNAIFQRAWATQSAITCLEFKASVGDQLTQETNHMVVGDHIKHL